VGGAAWIGRGLLITLGACALCVHAAVVPTEAELERARPGVEALTDADLQDLKAGRKSHPETAGAFLAYAETSEDEAARYLLVRAAYRQFVLGGELTQVLKLQAQLTARAGTRYAMEVARFSAPLLTKLANAKAPGAKEFLGLLAAIDRRLKDPAAEPYLVFEEAYPRTGLTALTSGDLGDFWWQTADEMHEGALTLNVFRVHAAQWYARALTNGTLRAMRRTLAERRCEEAAQARLLAREQLRAAGLELAERVPGATEEPEGPSDAAASAENGPGTPAGAAAEGVTDVITLAPQRNMTLKFRPPRGETANPPAFRITPWRITYEQFRAFRKIPRYESGAGGVDRSDPVRVTYDDAVDFAKWVTRKCRGKMPAGGVVRLPTGEERPQAPEKGELLKDGAFRGPAGFCLVLETGASAVGVAAK